MKILRFDSVGGASGDMILAALIDLGADVAALNRALASLSVEPIRIEATPALERGMSGTRATVHADEPAAGHGHDHGHHHAHAPHRNLDAIRGIIRAGDLPEPVKDRAIRVFERIGAAEAKVHGVPIDRVHFHEVGALDSIADIVGNCLALHLLGIGAVTVGPLPDGQGFTKGAHGTMPIPVPATAELLAGHTLIATDETVEMITPTGAGLLMQWQADLPAPTGATRIIRSGIGVGHRALAQRANLLRALLLETDDATTDGDECLVLECNLDDMTPELVGALTQQLLAQGALDVFTTAIQMKKQRPGILLTVLSQPARRDAVLDTLFRGSTTFGVREYTARRTTLARRHAEVQTPYGTVRVKIGTWRGTDVTRSPEYEDCLRCATAAGVPVRTVYEAAQRAVQ